MSSRGTARQGRLRRGRQKSRLCMLLHAASFPARARDRPRARRGIPAARNRPRPRLRPRRGRRRLGARGRTFSVRGRGGAAEVGRKGGETASRRSASRDASFNKRIEQAQFQAAKRGDAVVAAFAVNELEDATRKAAPRETPSKPRRFGAHRRAHRPTDTPLVDAVARRVRGARRARRRVAVPRRAPRLAGGARSRVRTRPS